MHEQSCELVIARGQEDDDNALLAELPMTGECFESRRGLLNNFSARVAKYEKMVVSEAVEGPRDVKTNES